MRALAPLLCSLVLPAALAAPAPTLEGTVTDAWGWPLQGALVEIEGAERQATTNAAGRFRFTAPPADAARLQVSLPGFVDRDGLAIDGPDQRIALEDVEGAGEIYGRVQSVRGGGLAGAEVTLSRTDAPSQQIAAQSDWSGRFEFSALPPGVYAVSVRAEGHLPAPSQEGLVVAPGSGQAVAFALEPEPIPEPEPEPDPEGTIVVLGERPHIDTESAVRGTVMSKEFISRAPVGRSYQSAVAVMPGVTGSARRAGARARQAGAQVQNMRAERAADRESREGYTDYGINGTVLTADDPLSTFAIDVDTASYSVARRELLQSQSLPPQEAVRVEEFVNYFGYDYPQPAGEAPFAVHMEAAPHPFQPSHHILRVGVQGRAADPDQRSGVHLTFLVDVSGSMKSSDKLPLAQRSLFYLLEQLGPDDTVALATYAGDVRRVLEPTPASEVEVVREAILSLSAGGSTAMGSGIDLAYEMADAAYVDGAENRVIVLSDGDANVGETSHDQILQRIARYADRGITLTTLGFGAGDYQDTMMEQLANQGDGNCFYVDTFAEAKKVFGQDLSGTLQTIARDVKIQVEFNPAAVYAYRLIGYENRDIADRDFRNDAVDAGEIGAGHSVTALYDVVLHDQWRDHEIATVRLRSKPPRARKRTAATEWRTTFPAMMVRDEWPDASKDYRIALGAALFAERLRGSPHAAEVGYDQIAELVEGAVRPGQPADAELLWLIQRADALSAAHASR